MVSFIVCPTQSFPIWLFICPNINNIIPEIEIFRNYNLEILDKITKGNGTLEDLDKLEKLCYYIKDNALCGLGQTAPNPVLSTLRSVF